MSRFIIALFLLLAAQQQMPPSADRPRTGPAGRPQWSGDLQQEHGGVHSAQPYHSNEVAPGTSVRGRYGNTATKAVEPGCAFVNGRRVCN